MTLILQTADDAPWATVARVVFWSRDVALATWRKQVLLGHPSYLPDSVSRMSSRNFIRFLGRNNFRQHWPLLRTQMPTAHPGIARLDAAWSQIATGTFNMPPHAALAAWPGRSREVFDAIVQHQGASIYEVAKLTGVPYRRAFDHIRTMEQAALVRSFIDKSGPRPRRRLYTLPSRAAPVARLTEASPWLLGKPR